MIAFNCPHCGQRMHADDKLRGKEVKCAKCRKVFRLRKKEKATARAKMAEEKGSLRWLQVAVARAKIAAKKGSLRLQVAAGALALLFALFVWPTPYRYGTVGSGTSRAPMRTNRITGTVSVNSGSGWYPWIRKQSGATTTQTQRDSASRVLPASELAKVTGTLTVTESGRAQAEIYNGSNYSIEEITVGIVVKESSGTLVLDRRYVMAPSMYIFGGLKPLSAATFSANVGFRVAPGQQHSWYIVSAKGEVSP